MGATVRKITQGEGVSSSLRFTYDPNLRSLRG